MLVCEAREVAATRPRSYAVLEPGGVFKRLQREKKARNAVAKWK
jgi:hypothetical protein